MTPLAQGIEAATAAETTEDWLGSREPGSEGMRPKPVKGAHPMTMKELAERLYGALDAIVAEQDRGDGNAPGHAHSRPGVWDDDLGNRNVGRANLPCEWCATWNRARHVLAKARASQETTR